MKKLFKELKKNLFNALEELGLKKREKRLTRFLKKRVGFYTLQSRHNLKRYDFAVDIADEIEADEKFLKV